jgi:hypothetical protein
MNYVFDLNPDSTRRDEILGLKWNDEFGGISTFEGITLKQVETLLSENFIDPQNTQNESPTAEQFIDFMRKYPVAQAHGYAVSPTRDDYRVTIEGLYVPCADVTVQLLRDFVSLCRDADKLQISGDLYSWWD